MSTEGLQVHDLRIAYTRRGRAHEVIKGVSFEVAPGETLGLVGESGSGKTTIGRALLGLAPVRGGSITFQGRDITALKRSDRRHHARDIQVVFQDPYSSLNPSMTIEDILTEPLRVAGDKSPRSKVQILLEQVGLPPDAGNRYPKEFSGGQRQRIAIARALSIGPSLIICDEPTSALDVTTQDRVLTLLKELQSSTGTSYLFISHDLGVVRDISHRIAVLHEGRIVESGPSEQISLRPRHPYTQRLQLATPVPDPVLQAARRQHRKELLGTPATHP